MRSVFNIYLLTCVMLFPAHVAFTKNAATPPSHPPLISSNNTKDLSPKNDAAIFNHQSFTLKNGLTVYFIKNTLAPIVNVSLYYKIGTADDPTDQHGLSHFVEHMMFKGTTRVPKGMFDNLLLKQGANYNAHTTPDYTCYEATIAKDQLELVLFLEADRMVNLTFTKEDIDFERQVVHEERAMRLDNNPFGKATEVYLRSLYWKHAYGIPAIGYPEHIDAYTYDSVQHHYKSYYAPNNAILIVAGDTTLDILKPLVEKYFGEIPSKSIPERVRLQEPDHGDTTISIDHYADRNHVVVIEYAYKAPHFRGKDTIHAFPLIVLSQILAGNELSRLWKRYVEEEKIAANIDTRYDHISLDPQTFNISMTLHEGTDPNQAKHRLEQDIQTLITHGVMDEEIIHAKRDILAGFAFVKDGIDNTVSAFSKIIFGVDVDDLEHWDKKISAVTKEQINEAIRYVFHKKPAVIATFYPKGYVPPVKTPLSPPQENVIMQYVHAIKEYFWEK